MRYERSPSKMLNELEELICQMVVTSKKFTKKRKEARNLYEEYLSSESEGYSMDSSGKEKGNIERTLWYENQREIIMKHNQDCKMGRESETRDIVMQKMFSNTRKNIRQ